MATRAQAIAKLAAKSGNDDDAFTAVEYTTRTAWIRNRATGNVWEVSGREMERTLADPTSYELLVKDGAGNMTGELGEILIPAPKSANEDDF